MAQEWLKVKWCGEGQEEALDEKAPAGGFPQLPSGTRTQEPCLESQLCSLFCALKCFVLLKWTCTYLVVKLFYLWGQHVVIRAEVCCTRVDNIISLLWLTCSGEREAWIGTHSSNSLEHPIFGCRCDFSYPTLPLHINLNQKASKNNQAHHQKSEPRGLESYQTLAPWNG